MPGLMKNRWEVGSEFDWSDSFHILSTLPPILPPTYELFGTGTSALLSIIAHVSQSGRRNVKLHLPSFFCMHVAASLQKAVEICWYRDLPTAPAPDFETLRPDPGDLVLAVNLFGVRSSSPWLDWFQSHDDVVLVEDHSHDPFSIWARHSIAHYAMASLRKTLPLPDGAILWSNQQLELPKATAPASSGAYDKLTAMILKRAYLNGANISKDAYRMLQIQGEKHLGAETNAAVSSFSAHLLNCLNLSELRHRRAANVKQFLQFISSIPNSNYQPLFTSWDVGGVPFNSILVCKNQEVRDALRQYLISQNIFTAVHWQQPAAGISSDDPLAIDLSNRIITIPTDHRYSYPDILRIAAEVHNFADIKAVV